MRDQQHRTSTRAMRALRRQPRPLRLSGAVNAVTPCRNDQGILQCWGWQQRRRVQAVVLLHRFQAACAVHTSAGLAPLPCAGHSSESGAGRHVTSTLGTQLLLWPIGAVSDPLLHRPYDTQPMHKFYSLLGGGRPVDADILRRLVGHGSRSLQLPLVAAIARCVVQLSHMPS